jgi:hypothetical protein
MLLVRMENSLGKIPFRIDPKGYLLQNNRSLAIIEVSLLEKQSSLNVFPDILHRSNIDMSGLEGKPQ